MAKEAPLVDENELDKVIDGLDLKPEQKNRLKARWLNYVVWWDSRAREAKWKYSVLRCSVIVTGALIPALVGLRELKTVWGNYDWVFAVASIAASFLVAVCVGLDQFFRFGDIWREKRAAAELIKVEGFRFFQLTGPYRTMSHDTAYPLFTERIEDLIEREIKDYIVTVTPGNEPKPGKEGATEPGDGETTVP